MYIRIGLGGLELLDKVVSNNMLEICQVLSQGIFMDEYYLAGGTALAVQIKHRKSMDLDFFTQQKINTQFG
jgi:predicted nucleotidyltransferase component of viral defense system